MVLVELAQYLSLPGPPGPTYSVDADASLSSRYGFLQMLTHMALFLLLTKSMRCNTRAL
jgi:hypothetical protein